MSYEQKHNQANGEDNRDGHSDNRSWNGGVEGATDVEAVNENRRRRVRSMLATMLLSQGVPMLSGGDEIGRTQRGNNNAYCQDNEISWHDWDAVDEDLLAFTQRLVALRKAHPVFRRRRFFEGAPAMGSTLDDIGWFRPDGDPMHPDDWHVGHARALSLFLNGNALGPQEDSARSAGRPQLPGALQRRLGLDRLHRPGRSRWQPLEGGDRHVRSDSDR